jgi:predicted nucleic acid-binding protein
LSYLLDTNIISALAPTQKERSARLANWLDEASNGLYLSVVTAAEVRAGIAKASREGASRKAAILKMWWDTVEHLYGARILAFDLRSARIAGKLMDNARAGGHAPYFSDVAIAATAEANQLSILTRNTKRFDQLQTSTLNPFDALPPLPKGAADR